MKFKSEIFLILLLVPLLGCSHSAKNFGMKVPLPFSTEIKWNERIKEVEWAKNTMDERDISLATEDETVILRVSRLVPNRAGRVGHKHQWLLMKRYFSQQRDPYTGEVPKQAYCQESDYPDGSHRFSLGAYNFFAFSCTDPEPRFYANVHFLKCPKALFVIRFLDSGPPVSNNQPLGVCLPQKEP